MNVLVNESVLTGIADSIRLMGVTGSFKPSEMPAAIQSISTGTPYMVIRGCLFESDKVATVSGTKIISSVGTKSGTKIILE